MFNGANRISNLVILLCLIEAFIFIGSITYCYDFFIYTDFIQVIFQVFQRTLYICSLQDLPEDPSYNFLQDRKRDRSPPQDTINKKGWDSSSANSHFESKDFGRHSRNFGGGNFNNVPKQMKNFKERRVCMHNVSQKS